MATTFTKINSIDPVVEYLSNAINYHLESGDSVLWLVSGVSAIPVEVAVAPRLKNTKKLTISLTDERPGRIGHSESNWFQLEQQGFKVPGATLVPVLTGGSSQDQAETFGKFLEQQLTESDFKIALFGIGPDGHTAGIPARHAEILSGMAALYEAGPFRRISMTPAAIGHLNEAVASVLGESKWPVLEKLSEHADVSASNLFRAQKLTIFNDRKGE